MGRPCKNGGREVNLIFLGSVKRVLYHPFFSEPAFILILFLWNAQKSYVKNFLKKLIKIWNYKLGGIYLLSLNNTKLNNYEIEI